MQAVPELVLLDGRAQHQRHAGKAGQHGGHEPAVDAAAGRADSSTAPPIRNSAIHTDDM